MSRIGKQPVPIAAGVKVRLADGKIFIEGPKGKLEQELHRGVTVQIDEAAKVIRVTRPNDDRQSRALHGLFRSLIANMVLGVTKGFEKKLVVEGVGYEAAVEGKNIVLTVGFANRITLTPPTGVAVAVGDKNVITVTGADKQKVGQFAAEIRHARPPEPYQGKGIRYEKEVVRRKEGKSFATGG
jgi:large subunit ribosomal protein L6